MGIWLQYYGRVSAPGSSCTALRRGATATAVAVGLAAALANAACGERSFTAEEFIDEANAHGVEIALGESLSDEEGGAELYAITLEDEAAAAGPAGEIGIGQDHGGGSLRIEQDTEAAQAEYARCEQAGLFCYRAANVVLVFEADAEPDALAELATALRAIQDE